MTRARLTAAVTLLSATLAATAAFAQTPPPMTSVLAGKKFTPPIKGAAEVEFTKPETKRDKDMIITKIKVRNASNAPIARLTIAETWYDKGGTAVGGSKGIINGLLQPGEVQTITIETPFKTGMTSNNYNFSHANGTVPKPKRVDKFPDPAKT
ncbi:MAG TPA: hypothetical protein VGH34_01085 [Vicinamibacterales bacterium]|jgi:hypothetical protein